MLAIDLGAWRARSRELFPGVAASLTVGAAAAYLAEHYATPSVAAGHEDPFAGTGPGRAGNRMPEVFRLTRRPGLVDLGV